MSPMNDSKLLTQALHTVMPRAPYFLYASWLALKHLFFIACHMPYSGVSVMPWVAEPPCPLGARRLSALKHPQLFVLPFLNFVPSTTRIVPQSHLHSHIAWLLFLRGASPSTKRRWNFCPSISTLFILATSFCGKQMTRSKTLVAEVAKPRSSALNGQENSLFDYDFYCNSLRSLARVIIPRTGKKV